MLIEKALVWAVRGFFLNLGDLTTTVIQPLAVFRRQAKFLAEATGRGPGTWKYWDGQHGQEVRDVGLQDFCLLYSM